MPMLPKILGRSEAEKTAVIDTDDATMANLLYVSGVRNLSILKIAVLDTKFICRSVNCFTPLPLAFASPPP